MESNGMSKRQRRIAAVDALRRIAGGTNQEVSEVVDAPQAIRLPQPHYQSTQARESLLSLLFALSKWPTTDMWSNVAIDPAGAAFIAQFSARVLAVSSSKCLAFRIVTLVYKRFRLQEYVGLHAVLNKEFVQMEEYVSNGVEHGFLNPNGLVLIGSSQTPARADALRVWDDLQTQWPRLADIFAVHQAEEAFLQTTEFWLQTLLLQGHESVQCDMCGVEQAGNSSELLHRVVMAALAGPVDKNDGDGEEHQAIAARRHGILPPGPVIRNGERQSITSRRKAIPSTSTEHDRTDARFELRYLVLCVWVRHHRTLFNHSKSRGSLIKRLKHLQYNFTVDNALLQLIDQRYHVTSEVEALPLLLRGAFDAVTVASWSYIASAAVLTSPLAGVAFMVAGAACGYTFGLQKNSGHDSLVSESEHRQILIDVEVVEKRRRERARVRANFFEKRVVPAKVDMEEEELPPLVAAQFYDAAAPASESTLTSVDEWSRHCSPSTMAEDSVEWSRNCSPDSEVIAFPPAPGT